MDNKKLKTTQEFVEKLQEEPNEYYRCKYCGNTAFIKKMSEASKGKIKIDSDGFCDEDFSLLDCDYNYFCSSCEKEDKSLG